MYPCSCSSFYGAQTPKSKIYVYLNAYTFMDIAKPGSLLQLSLRYHSLHQNTIPHNTYFYLFNDCPVQAIHLRKNHTYPKCPT